MSWLVAQLYDRQLALTEEACLAAWRADLLVDLSGEVLEVGAGTGLNLPRYPRGLGRLVLAEPDPHMRAKLAPKLKSRPDLPIEISDASLDRLPWPDASFDAVVGTLVLCSVEDPTRALGEIRRVLRPGGRFVFLEHVAAGEGSGRHLLQRAFEPVWRRVAGNCHLTRRTLESIEASFTVDRVDQASLRKAYPWIRPSIRGIARKAIAR